MSDLLNHLRLQSVQPYLNTTASSNDPTSATNATSASSSTNSNAAASAASSNNNNKAKKQNDAIETPAIPLPQSINNTYHTLHLLDQQSQNTITSPVFGKKK